MGLRAFFGLQEPTEQRKVVEKKQEFKKIGSGKKRKGQRLYAYDNSNNKVYEIPIESNKVIDITKGKNGTYKVVVNPNHPHLYALNEKNAIRKFNRLLTNAKMK